MNQVLAWVRYFIRAKGLHRIHSPFVYELYAEVIKKNTINQSVHELSQTRNTLLLSDKYITRSKIGAGSKKLLREEVKIKDIIKTSSLPEKYAKMLFRLVQRFRPEVVIELGTSLGLTTLYLSKANPSANIISIEGSDSSSAAAKALFLKHEIQNIDLKTGLFSEILPRVLAEQKHVDFVFLDGDHTYSATVENVRQIIPFCKNDSILIIDDIHWSRGMEQAWNEIKQFPEVNVTIDLFRLGIIFFRKQQVEQHFILKF